MMNDKQTQAVMFNLKEQRCLEKTMQTLSMEQSYSLSLLNLDHKVLKINYKRLKDRVSKIRSSLTSEEINEMKALENSGTIVVTPKKTDFDTRIAAASKRLKLRPTRRAQSATPRGSVSREMSRVGENRSRPCSAFPGSRSISMESSTVDDTRCKSSLGESPVKSGLASQSAPTMKKSIINMKKPGVVKRDAFMRTPEPEMSKSVEFVTDLTTDKQSIPKTPDSLKVDKEPKSILKREATAKKETPSELDRTTCSFTDVDILSASAEPTAAPDIDSRLDDNVPIDATETDPLTLNEAQHTKLTDQNLAKQASTVIQRANAVRKKSLADLRRATKLMAEGKTSIPFDSHSPEANDTSQVKENSFRSIREGVMYGIDLTTMENNIGADLHKEIKKGLLLGEVANSLYLEDKIDHYIDKVETYLEYTRRKEREKEAELIENSKKKKPVRNLLRRRQLQLRLRYTLDNPGAASWDDLVKCRYLRHPDGTIDHSDGVSTLVTDQKKLLEHMKMVGYEVIEPAS